MKCRFCFVSNSSSSSFVISLGVDDFNKFNDALDKHRVTYERKLDVKRKDQILNMIGRTGNIMDDFKECYYDSKIDNVVFVQFDKFEWNRLIEKEKRFNQEMIDERKENKSYYSACELSTRNKRKELLEKLEELGPDDTSMRSHELREYIQFHFEEIKNLLDNNHYVVEIEFNRDGDCPQSEIEQRLSNQKNFEDFLLENKIKFELINGGEC